MSDNLARAVITAKVSCATCAIKESAPRHIVRYAGELYYCPIHNVYVRPDESACEHYY